MKRKQKYFEVFETLSEAIKYVALKKNIIDSLEGVSVEINQLKINNNIYYTLKILAY